MSLLDRRPSQKQNKARGDSDWIVNFSGESYRQTQPPKVIFNSVLSGASQAGGGSSFSWCGIDIAQSSQRTRPLCDER
jgi:hypothetical protein